MSKNLILNLYKGNPLVVVFMGVAFCAVSLAMFLFSLPPQSAAAEGAVAPARAAAASVSIRPLEMHIAQNGQILLRSARVMAVSGPDIVVSTAWGSVEFVWIVRTNASSYETRTFGTRFLGQGGSKSSLGDIRAGELVTVTGMIDGAMQEPTLDADSVRSL